MFSNLQIQRKKLKKFGRKSGEKKLSSAELVELAFCNSVSTTLHAALGLFTQEKCIEAKYTNKKFNLLNCDHYLCCFFPPHNLALIEIFAYSGNIWSLKTLPV